MRAVRETYNAHLPRVITLWGCLRYFANLKGLLTRLSPLLLYRFLWLPFACCRIFTVWLMFLYHPMSIKRSFLKEVVKTWGNELWVVNGKYCGKILRILPGHQCSLHCHPKKSETFFGFDGEGEIELDGKVCHFGIDDIVDIPAGSYHRFINNSDFADFVLMEFSTRHDDKDVIRKEESR